MEGQSLTYKELNDKANQVARVLRQKGVQPETIVGLMTERSSEMIIGLMGILKAGGAYLPIDPAHPVDRIGSVLSDAKVDLLVTYGDIPSTLPYAGHVIDLTDQSIYQEEKTNLDVEMTSRHLAYVIYTSGSTGVPKGVMVEHQQVNNFIHGMVNETQLGSYESILCLTTLSFDIFGLETLAPLTKGLTVVVSNEEESKEGEKLAALIERNEIEVMQSTPTRLKMLMENERFRFAMKKLKTLFVGGEELSETLWNEVKGLDFPVFNMYGPTETTIWSTIKHMKETDSITIGKPIQNTQVYVLDRHNQLVPEGVLGELCISGDGVARGYFNREELTREKFVPNPFVPGERMYKTGDLVRWLPTGELAYAGRIDHQVKIRGFRIELGEIETQIISHPQVKEAVVAAKEDEQNQKYLCAYVVSHETLDKSGLKAYLKERLPDYMIPSYMMELDNIPLTNNGKINRTALPEPGINGLISGDYEAPQTALQETLVTIWRDVLGVETIGIHDNFFDLGGHSLKATVVMSDIHKLLQIEVPLKEIFTSPTIFELSGYIEKSTVNVYETIKLCEEQDFYETSSAQKRMYSVQQLDKGSTAYNMPGIFELEGEVDQNRIGTVFQQLVKRHEALRTSYETVDGEIVQKIWPTEEFQIISREHSATDIADIAKSFIQPFELERAPLFRVELAVVSSKQYLMIDMHHIISDGVSMSLLLKEFTKLYNGESLEPLRIQYKDFAQWQNAYLRSGGLDQQAAYWKKQFQGNVPVLHLPYDYERPVIQSFEGDSVHFILDEEMTEGLREVARKEGATLHMILLSAFNILLSKYSGQEDIVVGVPVAGRSHADLRNMMGMFVNTLAMRNRPEKEKTFK
ncbi:non-ribosomal peptide synthetase, partial [Bacillus wiedmannii]